MDRKKEEMEELNKQTSLTSNTPTTTKATVITTRPADNDTSTDSSDTLESWTIVNDKEKIKLHDNVKCDSEDRIESLEDSGNDEEDRREEQSKSDQELQLQDSDDFSDGISIISEGDSMGRISPHPYVSDHLHGLNMKFSLNDYVNDKLLNKMQEELENITVSSLTQHPTGPVADLQLRQRCRPTTEMSSENNSILQKAPQKVTNSSGYIPLAKRSLKGIFFMGVGLTLLCLMVKLVKTSWRPMSSTINSVSISDLEQKILDMELQNNFMRAEIDLLNKQVKYLSSRSDFHQQKSGKYNDYKQSKTFKAWPGNGDSLKPVDITKQDLRKPYRCTDGSFVEIANMCIEQRPPNEPSIVDQFGHAMEDLKDKYKAFKTFEQVAEELHGFQDSPFEHLQDIVSEQMNEEKPSKQFIKNNPVYESPHENKENLPYTGKYEKHWTKGDGPSFPSIHKHNKYGKGDDNYKVSKENMKSFGKDEYKQNREHRNYAANGNLRSGSEEKQFDNNSKQHKYHKDHSKERYTRDFYDSKENSKENQSKERYNKQKRKYDDDRGDWQEKYMKHREEQRKKSEQKYQDNKNWYIKRGDSRESKRSGEKQYR